LVLRGRRIDLQVGRLELRSRLLQAALQVAVGQLQRGDAGFLLANRALRQLQLLVLFHQPQAQDRVALFGVGEALFEGGVFLRGRLDHLRRHALGGDAFLQLRHQLPVAHHQQAGGHQENHRHHHHIIMSVNEGQKLFSPPMPAWLPPICGKLVSI
jgi:hypothetical protein